jgi:UMF1 family MFS transporter
MLFLKQRGSPQKLASNETYLKIGFSRLLDTFRHIQKFREMVKLMISYFFYGSGIATVISFAAIFASAEFGFSQGKLILLIVVVNITSSIGAFVFGFFQDKTSAKTTLLITLVLWFITVMWAYMAKSQNEFWFIANLAGLAIGASQSSTRALVGLFAPKEKQAEFYGFWGFFGKASSILGIYSYGFLASFTGSRRIAILSTGLFFLIGLLLLLSVNEKRGREAAKESGGKVQS